MKTAQQIGPVVLLLLTYRNETRADLAARLGLSVKSVNRRLAGELGWQAEEVYEMAEHFDVSVSVFFDGPDALMGGRAKNRRASDRPDYGRTTRQKVFGSAGLLVAA